MVTTMALECGQEPTLVLSAFEEWSRLKSDFNKRELFCFGEIEGFAIGHIDPLPFHIVKKRLEFINQTM
jgi:hypothetical protein